MSIRPKTTPVDGSPSSNGNNDQREFRTNPEIDAKIDGYIKENPKYWVYIQSMPRDRLERSMVLTEVQKLDRQQRIRDGIMKEINAKPELKQAYDTLLKSVPENMRDSVMAQVASQARRVINRSQQNTLQTP